MSTMVIVVLFEMFLAMWNAPPSSLGELAFREAVRRQATPQAARRVTDKDLGPVPDRPARPVAPPVYVPDEMLPGAKLGEKPVVDADRADRPDLSNRNEAWWRSRMMQARAAAERDRLLVTALESRVGALTRDVANRDNPVERAALAAERIKVLEELDQMRLQLTADIKTIADIEEEARRAGVPPGWLR